MSRRKKQMTALEANELLAASVNFDAREQKENAAAVAQAIAAQIRVTRSMLPAVGQMIYIQDRPFTEGMAPMMEPAFSLDIVPSTLFKCGRQVGKSMTMAAKTIVMSATIPYFNTLTVTPQFEMTRRYSANYVRPMIEQSPIGNLMLGVGCNNSVLQKTFTNNSMMFFSFAFLDCDRMRGIAADRMHIDEAQDIDPDFLPIIAQTMGRSKWRIQDFSGTPKTFDNTLEILWQQSSKAEWVIKCDSCGYWNTPSLEGDILRMVGDTTLVCARCTKPLNGRDGQWYHGDKDKRNDFVGYHVPQIVLPFHYESRRNWKIIKESAEGAVSRPIFYNEILAESFDTGAKLVTETDIKKASVLPYDMTPETGKRVVRSYMFRAIGIDWGGRGVTGLSLTKIAVIGMLPDGTVDLIYGESLGNLADEAAEIIRVMQIYHEYNCSVLAHDTGGSGLRDVFLSNSKFPMEHVFPFAYVRSWVKNPITFHPGTDLQPRAYYSLDKARSLALMANMIKSQYIKFPSYESCKHLTRDFLALVEEKNETKKAGDVYLITRAENMSDDFAHAVNFACMATFHIQGKYPDLLTRIEQARFELSEEQAKILDPDVTEADWENPGDDEDYL